MLPNEEVRDFFHEPPIISRRWRKRREEIGDGSLNATPSGNEPRLAERLRRHHGLVVSVQPPGRAAAIDAAARC